MSDVDPVQIMADLTEQGLIDDVEVEEVRQTFDLFASHPAYDPNWTYDPDGDPAENLYAPTAAEMYPDMVPATGWPPPEPEGDEMSAGVASPTGTEDVEAATNEGVAAGDESVVESGSLSTTDTPPLSPTGTGEGIVAPEPTVLEEPQ